MSHLFEYLFLNENEKKQSNISNFQTETKKGIEIEYDKQKRCLMIQNFSRRGKNMSNLQLAPKALRFIFTVKI